MCEEIVKKISKILHARHNYALFGKFGRLKDTLLIVIEEARQKDRSQQNLPTHVATNSQPADICDKTNTEM